MHVYSYPEHLADYLLEHWPSDAQRTFTSAELYDVVAVAYHASFLRDEDRPVRARLLVCAPDAAGADGPVLRWRFERPRNLMADELRRLAPAAPFETALLCVDPGGGDGTGKLWGVAHSGGAWLAPAYGGRSPDASLRGQLIIHVVAPGRIAAFVGERFLAELEGGEVHDLPHDVFESRWLAEIFAPAKPKLELAKLDGTRIDHTLVRVISQQMVRRVLALLRTARHGGMLLFVDRDEQGNLPSCVRIKYELADEPPRRRHKQLLERVLHELEAARHKQGGKLDCAAYAAPGKAGVTSAEKDIFELSRFVAGLTSVDGAVVLDKHFELLGFGAEVVLQSDSPPVYRALDGEANERLIDDDESVGTRHRAAYRFANAHRGGLAIVVSQDGGVRFVTHLAGEVTYFEQKLGG